MHLRATGGVARMAASFRGRYDFGKKLECANCHRVEADGVRVKPVEMERDRSEEHTSELQSLMRISYAVFCLKKKNNSHSTLPKTKPHSNTTTQHKITPQTKPHQYLISLIQQDK